jgi:catalase
MAVSSFSLSNAPALIGEAFLTMMQMMTEAPRPPHLARVTGAPVSDNFNIQTAAPRGPALLQDIWLIEKLANFDREVIPERRMHAKGAGAHGTFTVTHDITRTISSRSVSSGGSLWPFEGAQQQRLPWVR